MLRIVWERLTQRSSVVVLLALGFKLLMTPARADGLAAGWRSLQPLPVSSLCIACFHLSSHSQLTDDET
jgi:hypothetical protein